MLTDIDPLQAFVAGAAVAALVGFVVFIMQRQKLTAVETERQRLEAVALKAKEMLAATPDGLFLWDHANGGFTCSRRLAVLLNLKDGILSRYDDLRERFEGESLKTLEQCVSLLRGAGTPFDVMLISGRRRIQAIGGRAETDDGNVLADMVWMRDITSTGETGVGRRVSSINTSGLEDRHLTALLDAMPLPVWLRDSKLSLAFINHAARNVVSADAGMAARARQQRGTVTERMHVNAGGEERLLEISETPLGILGGGDAKDGDSNASATGGTIGFAIDRTESEVKEDELARFSAERNPVLETLDTGIAIFDADAKLRFFNAAYATLWDLEPDWLAGDPELGEILERLREHRKLPELSDFRDYKMRLLEQFETLTQPSEELMHLPDGRAIRALVNRQGKGGLVFVFDDVSDRLDLERSFKSLIAVQKETLDNLHEGIAVFGADGRLKLFNPVFMGLWGLDEAMLTDAFHVSDFVDHSRQHLTVEGGWDDLSWGVHKDMVVNRLMRREASTGKLELANGTVIDYANLPLPDGAMLLSYLDVTDTAQVETALRQRAEALGEADRLKNEFIANVSFEVRTPLTTVIGFADMLGQEYFGKLNRRQAEYAKGILETTNGMMAVVGDILDLASIEAGRLKLDRDTLDVHELLVSALNLIRDRARKKEIKLEFDCPPDIGWIDADAKRLKQVIFNLLTNATTFTPERGTVRLEARREDDDLILTVADTGIGIPQADRERVFQPFDQGSNPEADKSGAGLGLSLVRNFIALHDGAVDVKSPPGRGTTITCRLPAKRPDKGNAGDDDA
ncbi:MAG TPA: PAS domain-containing sensor histidine kinase [Rhodospirillales bacterium]|nr:PAS domain-containing sensor histidine kinase [Rhodospirillales bacterium]